MPHANLTHHTRVAARAPSHVKPLVQSRRMPELSESCCIGKLKQTPSTGGPVDPLRNTARERREDGRG
eukprot:362170-Chlamydomonas_euryale.AAC.1